MRFWDRLRAYSRSRMRTRRLPLRTTRERGWRHTFIQRTSGAHSGLWRHLNAAWSVSTTVSSSTKWPLLAESRNRESAERERIQEWKNTWSRNTFALGISDWIMIDSM